MKIISTELNDRLSKFVNSRITVDESYFAARAAFWRLTGFGILMFGIGSACGAALYGYSYISGNSESLMLFSSTLSKKLSEVQFKAVAEGTVKIEPNEINLAKGQSILIDNNSKLHLEQPAQIQVGEIKISIPAVSNPQPQAKAPIIKQTFTIFKSVPFSGGTVMTGWNFMTNLQKSPTSQYCYYTENTENEESNVVINIADDRKLEKTSTLPKDFDIMEAFNRCVWFKEVNQ